MMRRWMAVLREAGKKKKRGRLFTPTGLDTSVDVDPALTPTIPAAVAAAAQSPGPDRAPTVRALVDTIAGLPDNPTAVGQAERISPEMLTVQIDRSLSAGVWNGTTFTDRLTRAVTSASRTLVDEVEKSLLGQESYDDFERRMLGRLGVGPMEPDTGGAAMRALDTFLDTEVRVAWGEGLVTVNQVEDTVLVARAVLDDRTTLGCWQAHGRTREELGADYTLPRHWRCRCDWLTVPNPASANREWAAMGQAILDEMAEERDAGDAEMMERWVPPIRPSRFRSFRDAGGGCGHHEGHVGG